MDRPKRLTWLLIVLVKILESTNQATGEKQADQSLVEPAPTSEAEQEGRLSSPAEALQLTSQADYFEPSLIGFRCDGASEQTVDGVSVIEANSPVRITLFGEGFTTETIVGFTNELVRKADIVDEVISSNEVLDETQQEASPSLFPTSAGRLEFEGDRKVSTSAPSVTASPATEEEHKKLSPTIDPSDSGANKEAHSTRQAQLVDIIDERKFKRRLLGKNYDCTDHDRVISYKLTNDNIVTPNVAVLTVRLPELDWSSSGVYYYFCLKQPPLLSEHHQVQPQQLGNDENNLWSNHHHNVKLAANQTSQLTNSSSRSGDSNGGAGTSALVWVHQGDEWWLTLKVEPPILSIYNDCVLIVLLLSISAVTSGLNLGLMSLDMNELAVISSCGDHRERSYARTIAPLRKRGNYLLCSLLLGNVMVNATLTVILEEMTSGLVAVIGSTLAIVVLGEIVPQAFCQRRGLAIGAKTIYLTYAFMIITFPLSYPISYLLDCILGEEKGNVYDRERLLEFIRITGNHTQLEADEVAIISGALKLKKIRVDQIMTRIEDVFMLPIECMLDRETIKSIIEKGYSRIPIYEFGDRKQIVALILAKDLALLDPDDQVPLANMLLYCKHPLILIESTATLDVALNEFKTGKSHMAIVRQIYDDGEVDKYYEAIGVVTLEDVIEEVLQTEINDETDTLSDNRRKRRRAGAQVAQIVENLAQQQLPNLAATNQGTKF